MKVSIRAPVRGATTNMRSEITDSEGVSIRAPVRGATSITPWIMGLSISMFQSAPPCGGRRFGLALFPEDRKSFNPRPRAGGDIRPHPTTRARHQSFNPRPRAGGDVLVPCPPTGNGSSFNPRPRAGGDPAPTP